VNEGGREEEERDPGIAAQLKGRLRGRKTFMASTLPTKGAALATPAVTDQYAGSSLPDENRDRLGLNWTVIM
jgi:hypothetical protein